MSDAEGPTWPDADEPSTSTTDDAASTPPSTPPSPRPSPEDAPATALPPPAPTGDEPPPPPPPPEAFGAPAAAPPPAPGPRPARRIVAVAVGAFVLVGGLVAAALLASGGGPRLAADGTVVLSVSEAADRFVEAGCASLDVPTLEDRDHLDPATAPPEDALYGPHRPTSSGPHYAAPAPLLDGVAREPLDERATTHNLEHGAVVVWLRDGVEQDVLEEVDAWVRDRNDAGFANPNAYSGVFASRATPGVLDDDTAVALRAWGVAVDCASWDATVADAFLVDNFGTHGTAPEARFGPFPEATFHLVD